MKKLFLFLTLLLGGACIASISASNKVKQQRIYMMGYAISFLDSTAYITAIQALDAGYIDTKTGFLINRPQYSEQLHTYLMENKQTENITCSIYFNKKKQKLEKTLSKFTSKLANKENLKLNVLNASEFQFQPIPYVAPTPEEEAAEKAQKEKEKAAKAAKKGKK